MPKSPDQIAGLTGWFRASAITGLADGNPVGTWPNDGSGVDATQGTAANKPTYKTNQLNGLPIVRFDGVDDFMKCTADHLGVQNSNCVIVVAKLDSTASSTADHSACSCSGFGASQHYVPRRNTATWVGQFVTGAWRETSYVPTLGQYYVFTWRYSTESDDSSPALNHRIRVNKVDALNVGNYGSTGTMSEFYIGSGPGINFFKGDIAEVVVYDEPPSLADLAEVEQWLMDRYFTTPRRGIVDKLEFRAADFGRRGLVDKIEFNVPSTERRGIVDKVEFRAPLDARRGVVDSIRFDAPIYNRAGIIDKIEFWSPLDARRGIVDNIEFRTDTAARRGIVDLIEFVIATAGRRGIVDKLEFWAPIYNRRGLVTQIYFVTPSPPIGTGGPAGDTPATPGGIDPTTGLEVMITFERLIELLNATAFEVPRGKQSWAHYGGGQFRPSISAGRMWEEEYAVYRTTDPLFRAFLAYLNDLAQNERIFMIDFPDYAGLGSIAGTPVVSGAGQVGYLLRTIGWTGTMKRGDIIQVGGLNHTLEIVKDVTAAGTTDIAINPGLREGMSPQAGALISYGAAVRYRAKIDEILGVPESDWAGISVGLKVRFREVP